MRAQRRGRGRVRGRPRRGRLLVVDRPAVSAAHRGSGCLRTPYVAHARRPPVLTYVFVVGAPFVMPLLPHGIFHRTWHSARRTEGGRPVVAVMSTRPDRTGHRRATSVHRSRAPLRRPATNPGGPRPEPDRSGPGAVIRAA